MLFNRLVSCWLTPKDFLIKTTLWNRMQTSSLWALLWAAFKYLILNLLCKKIVLQTYRYVAWLSSNTDEESYLLKNICYSCFLSLDASLLLKRSRTLIRWHLFNGLYFSFEIGPIQRHIPSALKVAKITSTITWKYPWKKRALNWAKDAAKSANS